MCGKSYGRKEKESNKDCKQERSQNWAPPLREVGCKWCVNGPCGDRDDGGPSDWSDEITCSPERQNEQRKRQQAARNCSRLRSDRESLRTGRTIGCFFQ